MPNNNILLGGHSIVIVGYDQKYYKFINSWGETWGNNGYGFIPCEYINNIDYSDEFFILKKISNPKFNSYNKKIN